MKIRVFLKILPCVLLLAVLFSSCTIGKGVTEEPAKQAESFYELFDTVSVVISYEGDDSAVFKANCDAVEALLKDYHRLCDIYFGYAGINNLKTINDNAGIAPVKVDERLIDLLLYSKEIYTLTNGETNIAMGSVLKLWHDAREIAGDNPEKAYIPSSSELEEAAKHTDIDSIVINEEEGTVFISDPKTRIDVGAIAKGYATERAAELLIERGVTSYVLNIGGNIRAIGEKVSGDGWKTGITNPDKSSDQSFACRVEIKNISLVTSGDYERYYTVDGIKYHHIIDKDTALPADHFSSVSVFTEDSGLADALSTALFCMSYEEGRALVEAIGNIDVIWITSDGTLTSTDNIVFCEN